MNKPILTLALLGLVSTAALADKPASAGNGNEGKPAMGQMDQEHMKQMDQDQMQEHMNQMNQGQMQDQMGSMQGNMGKSNMNMNMNQDMDQEMMKGDVQGLEKQTEKKSQQMMNETDKGSETGQAKREENSKKWWKFWE